jgi:hypothetical protein
VFRKVDSGKKTVVPTDNKVMKTKLSSTGIFFQTLEKKSLQEYYSCVYDIKKRSKVSPPPPSDRSRCSRSS